MAKIAMTSDKKIMVLNEGVESIPSITIDSELIDTSTNPVQNKVIKAAIDAVDTKAGNKQDKIGVSGLLKGDGTTISAAVAGTDYVVPSTALEEVPGHIANGDIHVTAEQKTVWNGKPSMVITKIPKGRMRGDIKGIGKVGTPEDIENSGFINSQVDPANPDSWACDVDADGMINPSDGNVLYVYNAGNASVLTKTPTFADFYNNWTYHKVDDLTGYWTTDLAISGITAETDVSISVQGTVRKNTFIKAEPLAGGVRIHANYPPIRALPCSVTYGKGTGQSSICAVEGISDLEETIAARETTAILITLLAANWSSSDKTQVVDAPGVIIDPRKQQVILTPAPVRLTEYYDAGIRCIGRRNDALTFKCDTVPTVDMSVIVSLTPVNFIS